MNESEMHRLSVDELLGGRRRVIVFLFRSFVVLNFGRNKDSAKQCIEPSND